MKSFNLKVQMLDAGMTMFDSESGFGDTLGQDGDEKVHTNLYRLDEDMALLSTVTKKSLVSQNQNTLLFG